MLKKNIYEQTNDIRQFKN
jgi:hypothetical protein